MLVFALLGFPLASAHDHLSHSYDELTTTRMGLTTTLKGMVGFHTGPEGPREEGQSSSLPPAGQQSPPSPHFQGPGGEEAPQNGGNCDYERVGMEPASNGAAERAAAASSTPTTP